ncbi:hypothetical protein HRbin37_00034 [bacterium HR37]|nr:hypothetical protein HRbin37_00034 [bacterium HR37]
MSSKKKGHLLICTYYFPPIGTPRSYRWVEFVKHLSSKNWDIDVLTIYSFPTHPNYDYTLLKDIPEGVRVFRTYPGFMHHLSSLLLRTTINKRNYNPATTLFESFTRKSGKLLFRLFESTLRPIFIPDETITWLPFALIKARKLIKENKYTLTISSGFPFTCHILGFYLKQLIRETPWITDYGDPWVHNPSFPLPKWRSYIDKEIESRIVRSSNKIIVTTDKTKEHYLKLYPFLKPEKIEVIPQGFSKKEFMEAKPETTERFRIVYTGIFYRDAEPFAFFKALNLIKNTCKELEVIIAGNIPNEIYKSYIEKSNLSEVVYFVGFVSKQRAISLQKGASVLLLLGHGGGLQIPGKTYEYIAAQRPILSIKMDENDIASTIIERLRRGISVKNDPKHISEAIAYLYSLWKKKEIERNFNLEQVDEFCWDKLADKLEETILEIIEHTNQPPSRQSI